MRQDLGGEARDLLDAVGPAWDHELQGEMRHPGVTIALQRLDQLLWRAAQDLGVLRHRLRCHLDGTAAGQLDRVGVASERDGLLADALEARA